MSEPLEEYRAFIDGLLGWPRTSLRARQARQWGDSEEPERSRPLTPLERLLSQLSAEQRQLLADLFQEERDAGIHQVLNYLQAYQICKGGVPLAVEPFGTESYYDFIARRDGDSWPDRAK